MSYDPCPAGAPGVTDIGHDVRIRMTSDRGVTAGLIASHPGPGDERCSGAVHFDLADTARPAHQRWHVVTSDPLTLQQSLLPLPLSRRPVLTLPRRARQARRHPSRHVPDVLGRRLRAAAAQRPVRRAGRHGPARGPVPAAVRSMTPTAPRGSLRRVAAGWQTDVPDGCPLTNREYEVLSLVASGKATKQITAELGRSGSTVRCQISTGGQKLGAANRTAAVMVLKDSGWLGAPPRRPNIPDAPLSHGQMLYLKAFDFLLVTRTREAEAAVTICFAAMCWEAGARPQRRPAGIDGWLLSMAQRLTART